jgi:hypothetical protein
MPIRPRASEALLIARVPRRKLPERGKRGARKMVSAKQRAAARKNINKAAKAAKRKRTVAHLPKRVRTALGKQGAKAAKKKRR